MFARGTASTPSFLGGVVLYSQKCERFCTEMRANHSVKPTHSGLRPPRAAYLKR